MIDVVVWPSTVKRSITSSRCSTSRRGAHDVAVVACHAVALDHLRRLAGELGDVLDLTRGRADADDRAERQAERARVNLGVVALDGPGLLQPLEPLGDGGR